MQTPVTPSQPSTLSTLMPLLLVIIGGAIGILSNYLTQILQANREKKSIAAAFAGEIGALLHIVDKRKYIELFKADVEILKAGIINGTSIAISGNYFAVYNGNVSKIGLLDAPLPKEIATFYTIAMSIMEDIKTLSAPNGVVAQIGEALRERRSGKLFV